MLKFFQQNTKYDIYHILKEKPFGLAIQDVEKNYVNEVKTFFNQDSEFWNCYFNINSGINVSKSYQTLENLDSPLGNLFLGINSPNLEKAEIFLKRAREKNEEDGVLHLFRLYIQIGNLEKLENLLDSIKDEKLENLLRGTMYFYGNLVDVDFKKSIHYFEKSQDLTYSQLHLGMIYSKKNNHNIANEYYTKCYEFEPEAAINLGFAYLYGRGVLINYSKAKDYFKLSGEKGNEYLGIIAFKENDFHQAIRIFSSFPPKTNFGRSILGEMFYFGSGTKCNYYKARELFEKSKNIPQSTYFLGEMLFYGNGIQKDEKKGIEIIKNFIGKTFRANNFIGNCYLKGINGFDVDIEKAITLLNTNDYGKKILANYFFEKMEYKKSLKLNLDLYQRNKDLASIIGVHYLNGYGCPIDYELALIYFENGMKLNQNKSIENLAMMYKEGLGVKQDIKKSKELLSLIN